MTETLTIRLPKSLARDFRAKTRAAKTNPTVILRRAAADYVRNDQSARNAMVDYCEGRVHDSRGHLGDRGVAGQNSSTSSRQRERH
jgi:capsid protein